MDYYSAIKRDKVLIHAKTWRNPENMVIHLRRRSQRPTYCINPFMCVLVAQSCPTLCHLMDCSPPGSLSVEFSRQEYRNGLPFPSPGNLPDPGIQGSNPGLLLCRQILYHLSYQESPIPFIQISKSTQIDNRLVVAWGWE